jgi:hypothetical protein
MYFLLKTLPHSRRAQCETGIHSKPHTSGRLDMQIQICCALSNVKKGLLMYNRLKTCSAMNEPVLPIYSLTYMALTSSCFCYKTVLMETHCLLLLMKALGFALEVTIQGPVWQQVKLMTLHNVCKLRSVNEGVGSRINCTGYIYRVFHDFRA